MNELMILLMIFMTVKMVVTIYNHGDNTRKHSIDDVAAECITERGGAMRGKGDNGRTVRRGRRDEVIIWEEATR